jgi:hypothetical protein
VSKDANQRLVAAIDRLTMVMSVALMETVFSAPPDGDDDRKLIWLLRKRDVARIVEGIRDGSA